MEVIELPGYTEEEKLEIAKRFLVPRQREQNGVDRIGFEIPDETLRVLIRSYTREAGVRNLEREIAALARKVARRVAEEGVERPPADRAGGPAGAARARDATSPSSPSGSGSPAWPSAWPGRLPGGDILFIESTRMPGKGELKLTGSLGDVMRESAEAARSWLRAHAGDFASGRGALHEVGPPPARARRRRAQGRAVGGRGDGDLARLAAHRPPRGPATSR